MTWIYANPRADYVFTLVDGAFLWYARLQRIGALYATEAEYISTTEASGLAHLSNELGLPDRTSIVGCVSRRSICPVDVLYHFIR